MALSLSSVDQQQLAKAIEALLSPLAQPTLNDWLVLITREIRPLIRGESTIVAYSSRGVGGNFSADAPELAAKVSAATTFRSGEMHFADPVMEKGLILRRDRRMSVFTSAALDSMSGGIMQRSFFYNEVCRPFGARITYGLAIGGNEGEAFLGVNAKRPSRDPLSEDTLALLALLAPAFQAGFEMLRRIDRSYRALADALDTLTEGILVYDGASGRERYRNTALQQFPLGDRGFAAVERRAREVARALHRTQQRSRSRPTSGDGQTDLPPLGDIRTESGRYSLRASLLPIDLFAREQLVLVAVERHGFSLPSPSTLREHFGLTAREAQVALRLAYGDSDTDLALKLGVSPHTVRHHAERIFQKLDVHSRKALALRLVGPL
ncbi:MAG: helix-turn-helix transcriptional regulator [Gemmatimonadaceae bacterium]|nr:helix-turn-helix transcriptional regulator [Gemmatimonadaceae bacterium]